jgi:hypothetical protein
MTKQVNEKQYDPKHVKMAIGIASDPRHKGGDYTGAHEKIEKIATGLADHPQVKAVLKKQNETVKEGLGELAHAAERDHEVQMARAELYKLAKYSIKLHDMLTKISEAQGLEGWVQSKITKAAADIGSVYHHLDYQKAEVKMPGMATEAAKKGLYYNVNKRKKAGTSRDASHPKAPTAQAWKDAAKTAKKESVEEAANAAQQAAIAIAKKKNKKTNEYKESLRARLAAKLKG